MSDSHPSRADLERYNEVEKHMDGNCPDGSCERALRQIIAGDLGGVLPIGAAFGDPSSVGPPTHLMGATQPPAFAEYEVLGELGRGGMGVVYKAQDVRLNRTVALKTIQPSAGDDSLARRFLAEARAVAQLQYPNVVQIFEIRDDGDPPYIAMEFVGGGSLKDKYREGPPPPGEAAALLEILARAMHHAHEHRIVHRDLKPANVLLTPDGTPKIIDFGIARRLDETAGLTRTGELLGTPQYMAPEQANEASGKPADVTPSVDVHGLGAVLYWLLTGRPPIPAGSSVKEALELVRDTDPVAPHLLRPKIPRDLETICLKCLRKRPEQRYASAAALADDLRRFLDNEPILARPVGRPERLVKWSRRRPAAAVLIGVSALVVLLLVLGAIGVGLHFYQKGLALEEIARQKQEKEATTLLANVLLHKNSIDAAERDFRNNHADLVDEDLSNSPEECRAFEWRFVRRECHPDLLTIPAGGPARAVVFTPDGNGLARGFADGRVTLIDDLRNPKEKSLPVPPGGAVFGLALHPGGGAPVLAAAGTGPAWTPLPRQIAIPGRVVLWSLNNPGAAGESIADDLSLPDEVDADAAGQWVAWHPEGRYLAYAGQARTVKVWDRVARRVVQVLAPHKWPVLALAFSPDGSRLASAGGGPDGGEVKVWNWSTGDELVSLPHASAVRGVAFHPKDGRLATADANARGVAGRRAAHRRVGPGGEG